MKTSLPPENTETGLENQENLNGFIERITFHNPDSGFCVLRVKVKGHEDLIAVVGQTGAVTAGEYIEAQGGWRHDKAHGLQFQARTLRVIPPATLEGMEKYLGSGLIKGIGPHYAKKLITAFGEQVFEVIEKTPKRLLTVEGIGKVRVRQIIQGWSDQKAVREIMVFLQSHGISTSRAVRIHKTYGEPAIDLIRENPYRLAADIRGIGFKTADQLAQRLGIGPHSVMRAQAGLNYTMLELSNEGHCAYPRQALIASAMQLLEIPGEILETALQSEIAEGRLILENAPDAQNTGPSAEAPETSDASWVYLPHLHQAEVTLSQVLGQLSQGCHPLPELEIAKAIEWVEGQTGLALAQSQRDAIAMAVRHKVLIITGGPGTGKTTLVNSILKIFKAKKLHCLLCAPTGRAAKRLSESTGLEAKTIHRLLAFDPETARFTYGKHNPLTCDVLVVDETSMVDVTLMSKLLLAVPPHAAVLFVGDADQLPSVGPGKVLRDMMEADVLPVIRLTEIFRQAAQSHIVLNAHRINAGHMPEAQTGGLRDPDAALSDFYWIEAETPEKIYDVLTRLVRDRIPERFQFRSVEDIQVLTPMNRSGLGARALNAELQKVLNPNQQVGVERFGYRFSPGDKVMQIENNYEKEVFNGDIGVIQSIQSEERELTVQFDGRPVVYDFDELDEMQLAYACSIHKSQGSEYPAVILVLHTQHYPMLRKNLLYTGITRGKRLVILLGSQKAVWLALNKADAGERYSRLKARLISWEVSKKA